MALPVMEIWQCLIIKLEMLLLCSTILIAPYCVSFKLRVCVKTEAMIMQLSR